MARNLLESLNITPDGGYKKNPFPLTNYEDFHQKGGQFNVVGIRDTVPDSDYRMSVDGVTRTLLCNTANFASIKENYYFIHVPLGLISRNAYMMQVQRKENYSALDMSIRQMPVFSLGKVLKNIFYVSQFNQDRSDIDFGPTSPDWSAEFFDEHGFNLADGALKMMDMCGFGYYGDILAMFRNGLLTLEQCNAILGNLDDKYLSVARPAAYQCAWYHFFRNDIYDNDVPATCFNFDDITVISSYGGIDNVNYKVDEVRGAFATWSQLFRLRYNPVKKDIFTASMPGTQWGAVSTVNLLTDLEFDTDSVSLTTGNDGIDTTAANSTVNIGVDPVSRYDIAVLPPDSDSGEYGRLVTSYAPSEGTRAGIGILHHHSVTIPSDSLTIPAGTSLFDVLSLVEAQAIQKWRQKAMMAGNRTRDNWKAHYGVVPRHLVDHLPDFIGSVDNEIFVKEITSQANTLDASDGENNLGEIRGRGYGVSDKHVFRFHSNDYGVLLLIHAIVPENTYSSFGIDFANTMIFNTDFWQSEYNRIGLQVVPKFIANGLSAQNVPDPDTQHSEGTDTFLDNEDRGAFGYANRYWQYKQYPSKVHGMFNPSRFINTALPAPSQDVFGYSDMQSFVMPRKDLVANIIYNALYTQYSLTYLRMTISKLYVNPSLFDPIFAISATSSEETDTFFSHVRFNCEAMLPMDVTGLPKF